MPNKSINKYIEKFWDYYLKAIVYQNILLAEQKQQFCAGLPDKMNKYVNLQRSKSINAVIHHAIVALHINFNEDTKFSHKKATGDKKVKDAQAPNASKDQSIKKMKNQERGYKGKPRLSPEQMEQYRKENTCYKCSETGHVSRVCPTKKP